MASYDEPLFGIAEDDDLIAALVSGSPDNDPWVSLRFSVCVLPDYRRQGFGQKLVEAFMAYCEQDGFQPEAHVINPEAMNPMLEGLGFSSEGPIWTY